MRKAAASSKLRVTISTTRNERDRNGPPYQQIECFFAKRMHGLPPDYNSRANTKVYIKCLKERKNL